MWFESSLIVNIKYLLVKPYAAKPLKSMYNRYTSFEYTIPDNKVLERGTHARHLHTYTTG